MQKVKLTREQAERISSLLSGFSALFDIPKEEMVRRHMEMWHAKENKLLNELSLNDFCRALYEPDSYEVIPQFKVGDWVNDPFEGITQVVSVEEYGVWIRSSVGQEWRNNKSVNYQDMRHATPEEIQKEKERRWWTNHGREVWEIREGDILKNETHYPHFVTRGNRTDGGLKRTPSLNCVFREMDEIKSRFQVACFVEQRLDK